MSGENLQTAKIPSSDEERVRVGLGTYKTFDVSAKKAGADLAAVLKTFSDLGGSLVDSSPMYGRAEEVTGALSTELGVNERLFLATKVWTSGRENGVRQMEDSARKMARRRIDLMQIHNLVDWRTHLPTLRQWKEEGRIRYIGVSHYSPSAYGELEKILKAESIDFLQIPYSLAETAAEKYLIPLAQERGVAVIANEPFGHGALFAETSGKSVPAWAREMGIASWAQYFLKFILSTPGVTFVIPATRRLAHLADNMGAALGPLPSAKQRAAMLELR